MTTERHEISVAILGESVEPLADVAPEGIVSLVITNESDAPHDLRLVRLGDAAPSGETPPEMRILDVPPVPSGAGNTAEVQLVRGRYRLELDPDHEDDRRSVLDLTVQPVDGDQTSSSR